MRFGLLVDDWFRARARGGGPLRRWCCAHAPATARRRGGPAAVGRGGPSELRLGGERRRRRGGPSDSRARSRCGFPQRGPANQAGERVRTAADSAWDVHSDLYTSRWARFEVSRPALVSTFDTRAGQLHIGDSYNAEARPRRRRPGRAGRSPASPPSRSWPASPATTRCVDFAAPRRPDQPVTAGTPSALESQHERLVVDARRRERDLVLGHADQFRELRNGVLHRVAQPDDLRGRGAGVDRPMRAILSHRSVVAKV